MQSFVGGYIEQVYCDNGKILLVDEEGILKRLPVNEKATVYARENATRYGGIVILGNALLIEADQIE